MAESRRNYAGVHCTDFNFSVGEFSKQVLGKTQTLILSKLKNIKRI